MKTSRLQQTLGWAATGFASLSTALSTFNPGPSYSIGIPSDSSISSSSTGPLYFQLQAPTNYQWVGLGIGMQMAGATIFVMYADGNGNVTLSGRKSLGEVQPQADSTLQAGLELLEGTGIANGMMTANVRCTTCTLDSSKTSSSSPWIAAWSIGSAIDSTSLSANIRQHSGNSRVQAQVDLSKASISSDSNPFVSASTPAGSTTSPSSPSSTGSTSSPSSTGSNSGDDDGDGDDDSHGNHGNGNGNGNSNGGSNGSSNNNSGVTFGGSSFQAVTDYQKAHGIVLGVVVVLLFPLGSIFMRMGGSAIVHGILQVLSLCALLVGMGLGIKLANLRDIDLTTTHPLFGLILTGLFLIQPFLGLGHHLQYKRTLSRSPVSHAHIWYGRILMLLAIINGGLGLKLANNSKNGKIAYAVVAGVVGVVYIAVCVLKRKGSGDGVAAAVGAGRRKGRGWRREKDDGSVGNRSPGSAGEEHPLPTYGGQPEGRHVFK